ncbi:hypothetical protein CAEBREN_05702 [Caenorhabditis brenneri]|uniref:Uncharacterized protein n=1 Tax=Caenorhabditis brenneri TaxID=135651 RepID=G0N6Y0_CAEBE|nr:hypothetical protein CAEBREN_05702 [Caenorhabditis brenneri]
MAPQPSTIIAQQQIERVKKAQEVFKMKKLAPETPKGPVKSLLMHSALSRVKNMDTEWKEVVVVKTGSKSVDVRVLAASFDNMKV